MREVSLEKFYRGKTALVTGHTGFKGGWLSTWLKKLGARVVGYALPPEHGKRGLFAAARVARGMTSVFGDIRDPRKLETVFAKHKPELLFHLAAQPLVLRAYREPLETFETNVMGTANVLDCARRCKALKAIVVVTSDKCYDQPEQRRPRREGDSMGGADPYSASKGAAEIVAASYRSSFFSDGTVGVATARAGNVIGGGDWAESRLLPDCMRALIEGKKMIVRNPRATRPWQHVLEPVFGYLTLAAKLHAAPSRYAQAWNFGPAAGRELSALEIAELALESWGKTDSTVEVRAISGAPAEAHALRLDCSKARKLLGVRPLFTAEEAVAKTVEWHRAQADDKSFDGLALTLAQIDEYSKMGIAHG